MKAPSNKRSNSFHSPLIALCSKIAIKMAPIITTNPPNTRAVIHHLLFIIELKSSLNPVFGCINYHFGSSWKGFGLGAGSAGLTAGFSTTRSITLVVPPAGAACC